MRKRERRLVPEELRPLLDLKEDEPDALAPGLSAGVWCVQSPSLVPCALPMHGPAGYDSTVSKCALNPRQNRGGHGVIDRDVNPNRQRAPSARVNSASAAPQPASTLGRVRA